MKPQLAKGVRNYQRRAKARRESLTEIAAKMKVSVKVFKRALEKVSKTLKKDKERTRIRRADRAKTSATISKGVKHHSYRSVRRERQPVRKKLVEERKQRKIANHVPVGKVGEVGRRAMKQNEEELRFNSS
eukprot:TRINITY_DN34575_c0_g1_i1.p1 TRINITY_DN34575_c0_g1~~TRINITY_DN34575_c0_g1_i1.p1  ORF type:complete len:131 (-),score=7.77 TRINITY_DN34575_c0_g1_i1:50-442(-)